MNSAPPPARDRLDAPFPLERFAKKLFLNPLVNYIIPAALLRTVVRASPLGAESMARPGGWRALELCYWSGEPANMIDRLVSRSAFFPRAARNRRVLAVGELAGLIGAGGKSPLVLSLGSGPGRCEMEAMRGAGSAGATLVCIDRDSGAFEFGRELRGRLGLEARVSFEEGDVGTLAGMSDASVDIVTMLGFLGYFDDGSLARLLGDVFRVLRPGGSVMTNSITDAHGVDGFMERVFGWSHHYRAPAAVRSFLSGAGFEDVRGVPEPFGVYSIMIGKKA